MERETETWFAIEVARTGENDWSEHGKETFATARSARAALKAVRKRWPETFELRIVRKTLTTEVWMPRHVKPAAGKCPECGHYGTSCTGAQE